MDRRMAVEVTAAAREQSRARYPDESGYIERDGVRVFWERYGEGGPDVLLLPTWSLIHSRHWKLQIPYLARHCRVVTFDGRGNGRSDRPVGAAGGCPLLPPPPSPTVVMAQDVNARIRHRVQHALCLIDALAQTRVR